MSNALIVHGGAPTAVINASLYGVINEARKNSKITGLYAAQGGVSGILNNNLVDLFSLPQSTIDLLPSTPASFIGSSRYPLESDDYEKIAEEIKKKDIRYIFFNGGNGSMDTCGKIYRACCNIGVEVCVVGIPKTMDNDIAITDHSPGFGSAARYVAGTVSEVCCDVASLPIHVCVVEVMGRNAGWLTAASALAAETGFSPDLIYCPETVFSEDRFLSDIDDMCRIKKGIVVVVGESLRDENNVPIVPPVFQVGRSVYYGDVSAHLVSLVIKKLGIKARNEKPGICGRTSIELQSSVDRNEAIMVGEAAVRAAMNDETGVMVGIMRNDSPDYESFTTLIPIEQVMLNERIMPQHYINHLGNNVTEDFIKWCKPLIGGDLLKFAKL